MINITKETFNAIKLPIRAENLTAQQISSLRQTFDDFIEANETFPLSKLYYQLIDFFSLCEDGRYHNKVLNPFPRRFQIGLKGWGKTLSTLLALNKMVCDSNQRPLMFYYSQLTKNICIFPPQNIANEELWGTRFYSYSENIDSLINLSDVVVVDDIHYIFENSVSNPDLLNNLVFLLKTLHTRTSRDTSFKVLLISEEPLFKYAEQLSFEPLNKILHLYGQRTDLDNPQETLKIDWSATREVPYWNLDDWRECLLFYTKSGLAINPLLANIIFNINVAPRALIKFIKYFNISPQKKLTFQTFFEDTKNRLQKLNLKKGIIDHFEQLWTNRLATQEKYWELISKNIGLTPAEITIFDNAFTYLKNQLIIRNPVLKSKIPHFNSPFYVLNRFKKLIHTLAQKRGLKRYGSIFYLNCLALLSDRTTIFGEKFYTKSEAKRFASYASKLIYNNQLAFDERASKSVEESLFPEEDMLLEDRALYIDGILHEPFYLAYSSFLKEIPSSTIMSKV